MKWPMTWGPRTLELARALAVLALVILNFAHVPVVAPGVAAEAALLAYGVEPGYCGSVAPDHQGPEHAPCHACRIGAGTDTPASCGLAERFVAEGNVPRVLSADPAVRIHRLLSARPRGPPRA